MNTKNMTKAELREVLTENKAKVTNKSISDRISYTLRRFSKTTKATLEELVNDMFASFAPLPTENAVKPVAKSLTEKAKTAMTPTAPKSDESKSESKTETKSETKSDEPTAKATETTKAPTAKKAPKKAKATTAKESKADEPKKTPKAKKAPKKAVTPTAVNGATKNSWSTAAIFPQKFNHKSIGELTAVPDKYHTLDELTDAIKNDVVVIIAAYHPKTALKKFGYTGDAMIDERIPKGGFPHDLDIQQVIYTCEGMPRIYAMSDYTEAIFAYLNGDLTPIETVDSATKKPCKTRYAAGYEFELYELTKPLEAPETSKK